MLIYFFTVPKLGGYGLKFWRGGVWFGYVLQICLISFVGGFLINSNMWRKGAGKYVSMQWYGPFGWKEIRSSSENKAYEEGLLVEIIKTKVAVWLKACYDLKEYSVEDIKRSIQSIRKLKVSKILVD